MGHWPTRGNETLRRPRESGDPSSVQWIPASAGMTAPLGEPQAVLSETKGGSLQFLENYNYRDSSLRSE